MATADSNEKHAWFWKQLDQYLADKQLKQTKPRKIIVETFLAMDAHLDAEGLFEALRTKGHDIGLATVYRTLSLLKEAGLVEQSSFQNEKTIYELRYPKEHHDHLVCVDCNAVIEFESDEIEDLQTKVAKKLGFGLVSHRLDLYGRCQDHNCPRRKQSRKESARDVIKV